MENITTISVNMYLTAGIAVIALIIGAVLRKKLRFLKTFCIPAAVVGGLIFSGITCVLYATGVVKVEFDGTLKDVFMMMFFTTVGFQADLKALKKGGIGLVKLLAVSVVLMLLQNGVAIGMGYATGAGGLFGLCTGSIPMVGGHGTSAAFGPVLEGLGCENATTLCTAAATFGLIMGSAMGGPLARHLIKRRNLQPVDTNLEGKIKKRLQNRSSSVDLARAFILICFAMGIGSLISGLISLTGFTCPEYIGAMIIAAILRNVLDATKKLEMPIREVEDIGNAVLMLFLGIAMISLELWQLAALALPLILMLAAQTVLMFLYARFVGFPVMGKDYDAAVIASGVCGFGMGATPNAMANMQAVCAQYGFSAQAFLIIPIAGSLFVDFINSFIITGFVNIFR